MPPGKTPTSWNRWFATRPRILLPAVIPYHLQQLGALCRAHPVRPKVVFVPSDTVGHDLATGLSLTGQSWVNLRLTTPTRHAGERAEPGLLTRGWHPLAPGADLLLLREIAALVFTHPDGFFSRQAVAPGLLSACQRSVQELRLAGMQPQEARMALRGRKGSDFADLYSRYCERLERDRLYDEATLLTAATTEAESGVDDSLYAIMDGTPLPRLAYEYVDATCDGQLRRIGRADYGVVPDALSAAVRFANARHVVEPDTARPGSVAAPGDPSQSSAAQKLTPRPRRQRRRELANGWEQSDLFEEQESPAPHITSAPVGEKENATPAVGPGARLLSTGLTAADGDRIRLRASVGIENEVRGALRSALSEGIACDRIEIAYTDDGYAGLLLSAAERFDLPTTFAAGVPVRLTRPGRALAGFYRWVRRGCPAADIIHLCRSGDFTCDRALGETDSLRPHILRPHILRPHILRPHILRPHQLAAILQNTRCGDGREAYTAALQRAAEELDAEVSRGEGRCVEERQRGAEQRLEGARTVFGAVTELRTHRGRNDGGRARP